MCHWRNRQMMSSWLRDKKRKKQDQSSITGRVPPALNQRLSTPNSSLIQRPTYHAALVGDSTSHHPTLQDLKSNLSLSSV